MITNASQATQTASKSVKPPTIFKGLLENLNLKLLFDVIFLSLSGQLDLPFFVI